MSKGETKRFLKLAQKGGISNFRAKGRKKLKVSTKTAKILKPGRSHVTTPRIRRRKGFRTSGHLSSEGPIPTRLGTGTSLLGTWTPSIKPSQNQHTTFQPHYTTFQTQNQPQSTAGSPVPRGISIFARPRAMPPHQPTQPRRS